MDLARNATRTLPLDTHGIASRPSTTTWSPLVSTGGSATGTVTNSVSASESYQATSFTANWRASQIPDTGPNKVRPGTEDDQCENGAESSRLSSRTRP